MEAPHHVTNLLSLPLELREHIYSVYFSEENRLVYLEKAQSEDASHQCNLDILLSSKQILCETRNFLYSRQLRFVSSPGSKYLQSSLSCLHGLERSKLTYVTFELNPYQYISNMPTLWLNLAFLCRYLSGSSLQHLTIEFDGTLPRTKQPLFINETDLDRAPMSILLLLQPFNLLSNVKIVEIVVSGGPVNNLWSKDQQLQSATRLLSNQLQASSPPPYHQVSNTIRLRRLLGDQPEIIWPAYSSRQSFESVLKCDRE